MRTNLKHRYRNAFTKVERANEAAVYDRYGKYEARAVYKATRTMNLPRAPLHGPKPKVKQLPMNQLGRQGGLCFTKYQAKLAAEKAAKVVPMRRKKAAHVCTNCGHQEAA